MFPVVKAIYPTLGKCCVLTTARISLGLYIRTIHRCRWKKKLLFEPEIPLHGVKAEFFLFSTIFVICALTAELIETKIFDKKGKGEIMDWTHDKNPLHIVMFSGIG